ncbi:MAG: anaerobic ribonucleoside-triphosphate reductase activating protein [Alphaproteobacteria bacterium]|nr:anaerobic ribonucleoside-triphosphate reductase activating protein [Alphaproteobacteria bacterium]
MFHIAGVVPFTTIDFPDNLAGVVFFKGCPLRCPFCHNPALQELVQGDETWENVCDFFKERVRRLDGVVLSGGEPLMQPDIELAVQIFKEMGYKVAIHTSGVYPEKLRQITSMLDWVGLDVKAPWDKYEILSGRPNVADKVKQSIEVLQAADIPFETRTTCDPRYLTKADIERLTDDLKDMHVMHYAMQKYRTFDGDKNPPSVMDIESFFNDTDWIEGIRGKFQSFLTRE